MDETIQDQLKIFKAFNDETRLRVLEQLRGGEKCACDLLGNLDCLQSGLSYHMKILVESGIVEERPAGKWTHYRLSKSGSVMAMALIEQLTTPAPNVHEIKCCEN